MGNQQGTQTKKALREINHPKFKIYEENQDNDTLCICIPIENQSHFQEWQIRVKQTTQLDDEGILLPRSYRYERRAFCSSSGQLYIYFDRFPFILKDELNNRRMIRRYFDESELWYLVYILVYVAHDFKQINKKIGDVQPANIFVSEQGQIKIANLYSWPNQLTNYIKTYDDNQKTYLAPEELQNMKNGQIESYLDKFKAQSFSIGITLLEAALMRDMAPLYNSYTKNFNKSRLEEHLKDWWTLKYEKQEAQSKQKVISQYSDALKIVIASLCEINPEERVTAEEIYNWLKQYKLQINELREFNKQNIPLAGIQKYYRYLGYERQGTYRRWQEPYRQISEPQKPRYEINNYTTSPPYFRSQNKQQTSNNFDHNPNRNRGNQEPFSYNYGSWKSPQIKAMPIAPQKPKYEVEQQVKPWIASSPITNFYPPFNQPRIN